MARRQHGKLNAPGIEERAWGDEQSIGLLTRDTRKRLVDFAAGGDLAFEVVELRGPESARVALVVEGAEGIQAVAPVQFQPIADGAGADVEKDSNFLE